MMLPILLALCQFSEPPRPAPPVPLTPPAAAVDSLPDKNAGRPTVVLVTSPTCRPCAEAEAWIRTNGFPFEITRQAPRDGDNTPTWRFQGADGRWWQVVGWQGRATVEELVRAYAAKNPQPVAATRPKAPEKEGIPDTLRRFAGDSGTIVFRPDRKTRATVTDGVTLDVGEITARYDLKGEPRITFETPQPRGTVEKFGFGVGFLLQSAVYEPPNTVKVGTNWKTITVRINDD